MTTLAIDYREIEPKVKQALYDALGPHIAVGSEEVDDGRVFLKVVSTDFNGLSERKKQNIVWDALETLGPEAKAIFLVLAFGTDEI